MRDRATTLLIPFVYFIAGATSLAGVAMTFYYKEDLHLSLEQVGILGSIGIIPWSIKPVYGFVSDTFPIRSRKRKPYLVVAGIAGSIGYFSLATWVHTFPGAIAATAVSALGFALADVIVDGIVAQRSRTQRAAGRLQSICRAALLLGALIVAYASGILVEAIGARAVFLVTGTMPLFTSLFAVLLPEEPSPPSRFSFRETWMMIRGGLSSELLIATLFLFIWRATPTSGGALFYYMIDELRFTPEFFGRLAFISHGMGLVGVLFFRKWLMMISLRRLFCGIIVASVVLSLPSLGLVYRWYDILGVSPRFFAMADSFVSAPLAEIGFLPLMVLIARVCPAGLEATMFALLASVANIGFAVSDLGGSALVRIFSVHQATEALPANYTHLDAVLWIAILSSLLPLPLLSWLPETRAAGEIGAARGLPPSPSAPILPSSPLPASAAQGEIA